MVWRDKAAKAGSCPLTYIYIYIYIYIAHVKNEHSYTSTPLYTFTAWCLIKHNDLVFTIPITVNVGVKR